MKITYFMNGFGRTGGALVLYRFMDELTKRGHFVRAVTPGGAITWVAGCGDQLLSRPGGLVSSRARALAEHFPGIERQAVQLMRKRPRRPFSELGATTEALLRHWEPCDLTVASHWSTVFAALFLSEQTASAYHMQHLEELVEEQPRARQLARLTYFLPTQLIANSSWLRDQIRRRARREPQLVVPGIDTNVFRPPSGWRDKFVADGAPVVASYCSPVAFKGWETAEAAMSLVRAEMAPRRVRWTVYGSPPPNPTIDIEYVGRVFGRDLAALYAEANVTFMSSWYESFPLPPIEAMACGSPLVTTRYGTEDYAFGGQNCLVVEPGAPEALATAIVRLLRERTYALELAEDALRTASGFGWERRTDDLERALERSVQEHVPERFIDDFGSRRPGNALPAWAPE